MINILKTYNDKIIAKKLKRMLKNAINEKKALPHFSPKNDPVCYNALYPKLMKIYWIINSELSKIKKLRG